jgi:hypothetical protein
MHEMKSQSQAQIRVDALRKRKNRIAAIIDLVKTVMIYALTVSMLTFAGLYINGRQNAGRSPEEIPWEKMIIFETGGTTLGEIDENQINPVKITVTADGNSFTAMYNNDIISDIYANFRDSLLDIFGADASCVQLDREEGDRLWLACTELSNSVYIKYAGDYLYPVMYAFKTKTWNAEAFSGELALIAELFIVDMAPVYGVSRDSGGNVAVFMPGGEITCGMILSGLDTAKLESTYNDIAGVIPSEFLKSADISAVSGINRNNIAHLRFPYSFHLFRNHNTFSPELRFSNPLSDEHGRINIGSDHIKDFFELLSFNIERSGPPYSDREGRTYIDRRSTVKFYNNGRISYNGAAHLSKFLGYDAEYYTFYDKIKAASVFAGSLSGELTANGSGLYLTGITADPDGNLRIVFAYYYEGIKIKVNGSSEGIVIVINRDSISEVMINSLRVSRLQDMIRSRNPVLELGAIDGMISRDISDGIVKEETAQKYNLTYDKIQDKFIVNAFELVYNIDHTGQNDLARAAWEIR